MMLSEFTPTVHLFETCYNKWPMFQSMNEDAISPAMASSFGSKITMSIRTA